MDSQNQNPKPVDNTPLKTDLVEKIPMHQAAPAPAPNAAGHDDLDKVLHDVNKELKKEEPKPQKNHLFGHKEEKPASIPKPAPAQATAPRPTTAQLNMPAGPVPREPVPAQKPKSLDSKKSKPVMVIVFTLLITAFLVMAAVAAYKK